MEFGPGLELDPADPLTVQEHGGQAQSPPVLGHDLGRGPDVGEEPGAQVGELGLEGGRGDDARVALGHEPPRVVAGTVVGPGFRAHLVEGAAAEDRPHAAAQQSEHDRHHRHDDHGNQHGDDQLVVEVGGMGVAERAGRQAGAEVAEQPRCDGHPHQERDGERDEQPPGVPAEAAVEGPRDDEPGEGGRVTEVVHPLEPRGVGARPDGQRAPAALAGRRCRRPGLGVGRRRGLGALRQGRGGDPAVAGLDPDDPGARPGLEEEVHGTEVLDPGGGQGGHHVRGAVGRGAGPGRQVLRLVAAALTEDPPVLDPEEPDEGPGQRRMGVHGPARGGEGVRRSGEVEQVAGDDEDARAVPRVECLGQFAGDGEGRGGGVRGEQQVADDHHPSSEGDVDPGATGLEGRPRCPVRWSDGAGVRPVPGFGRGGHSPSIVGTGRR